MHTYINGTGVKDGVVFHQVDLMSLEGETIISLPLLLIDHSTLYNSTSIMPPDSYFYLKVCHYILLNFS